MDVRGDTVDFVPDRSQLARVAPPEPGTPPVWLAVAAIAGALGLSLSMALPPATQVRGGVITRRSADVTPADAPPQPSELLQVTSASEAGEQ